MILKEIELIDNDGTLFTYSSAVLLHGMSQFVVLSFAAVEEAFLAHVEVEAFQATVSRKESMQS